MIFIEKCDSYHTRKETTYLDPKTVAYLTGKWPENNGKIESEIGVCWGTKEQEECECKGNKKFCDFYSENRNAPKFYVANSGETFTYSPNDLIEDKCGSLTGIGCTKDEQQVWVAYYPEDRVWEIERYMTTIEDWKDYCNTLENMIHNKM